ncbi:hypothetical protein NDU88_005351 [Pleurodeles waltl]|uniref:Uncharacterized protein n=1 Tax=Pleurodeles waltl TaxID=8319 RepID=A0AAV7SLN0_PLEWA|nr:hypothetical protein NDU88_005351 [Pleurodeles waltl]
MASITTTQTMWEQPELREDKRMYSGMHIMLGPVTKKHHLLNGYTLAYCAPVEAVVLSVCDLCTLGDEEIAARLPDFRSACLPVGAPKPGPRVPERRHPRHPRPGDNAPAAHNRWPPRTTDFKTRRESGVPGRRSCRWTRLSSPQQPFSHLRRADPGAAINVLSSQ